MADLRYSGNARSRSARARVVRGVARANCLRQGANRRLRAHSARCRPGSGDLAHGALALAGRAQVGTGRAAEGGSTLRRILRERLGARPAAGATGVRVARSVVRAGRRHARLLASRACTVRRRLSSGRSGAQLLLVPLHAGGIDARERRARAGMHGVSWRHRADRTAGAGDGGARCGWLCRNAFVP